MRRPPGPARVTRAVAVPVTRPRPAVILNPVRAAGRQRQPWRPGHRGELREADQGGARQPGSGPAAGAGPDPVQGELEALDFHRSQFRALSPDHDLVQPPGRQLSQEREARDDHVRLSGKAPVPDPPGYPVLGADHRNPVGHEHDSKQHRHDGHHDHTPTMGPAAGATAGIWHPPGTRPSSPGLAAAAAAGTVAAGRQTMNRCGGHGHLPARPTPVRAAQAAASAMTTANLQTTRPVTPRNAHKARASHLA